MRRRGGWTAVYAALALGACADVALGPDPSDDPITNFDHLWSEFDRYYSYFELKQIDWDALYDVYRPQVDPTAAPSQLFGVMSALLDHLQDGHAELRTPFARYSYDDWYEQFPENFSWPVIQERLGASPPRTPSGIRHGWLTPDIGYLLFEQFGSPLLTEEFDQVLAGFSGARGLVLDVRNNPGGSDLRTEAIAGRFADRVRHYRTFRYRNGPNHDDFTVPELDSIRPAGDRRFTGPVVVLTNRRTFSAAESFVLAMRVRPGVTVVGDTTGGGAGNPISRELPNGWTYRISRWIVETPEGASYEGSGLGPDVFVEITEQDAAAGVDTILETAIALLAAP